MPSHKLNVYIIPYIKSSGNIMVNKKEKLKESLKKRVTFEGGLEKNSICCL